MKVDIIWQDKMRMQANTQSGHNIKMDGPPDLGGQNTGARPMEMLLVGLGGCTTVDVISTLEKMRQTVVDCQVQISADRADDHPKVFTNIHLHFELKGENLSEKKVTKAIELSAQKYCSASIMLGAMANITHDFKIK